MKVVTRFAPAPTGHLHIGGARTAIFNYLFSCAKNGKFLMRIDDTDVGRSSMDSAKEILDSLRWLGLQWDNDGEEMFQSKRFDVYLDVANELIDSGHAYRCYISDADAAEIREIQNPKMRRQELRTRRSSKSFTIRYMMPENEIIFVKDTIAGDISINSDDLDDFVMIRQDGTPTYMIASVVDDEALGITNIIRGNEHLTNTQRQAFLMKDLKYRIPIYTHVPLINNENRQKLSKRDGAVSVQDYREMGILPEAMFNYVLRLGWSRGNQEIITREEAKKCFNLEALRPSAACFDLKKLLWLNFEYMKMTPGEELLKEMKLEPRVYEKARLCIDDMKKKAKTLKNIEDVSNAIFGKDKIEIVDELPVLETKDAEFVRSLDFNSVDFSSLDTVKSCMNELMLEVNKKEVMMFLRVALTGSRISPGLFEIIFALGRDLCQMRLDAAQK